MTSASQSCFGYCACVHLISFFCWCYAFGMQKPRQVKTRIVLNDVNFRKKKKLWVWKNVLDIKEPKADIRAAFRVVVDKNWQGIAYLMLEVAGLDFLEAIQVTLTLLLPE